MYVSSMCTKPSYNDKNPPSVFFIKPYFKISNQAVLKFLSEWHSSVQTTGSLIDKDILPWESCLPLCRREDKIVIDRYRFFITDTDTDYLYVYVPDNRYAEPIFIYCYKVNK